MGQAALDKALSLSKMELKHSEKDASTNKKLDLDEEGVQALGIFRESVVHFVEDAEAQVRRGVATRPPSARLVPPPLCAAPPPRSRPPAPLVSKTPDQ